MSHLVDWSKPMDLLLDNWRLFWKRDNLRHWNLSSTDNEFERGKKKKGGLNISLYTVKRICYEIYCKYGFFFQRMNLTSMMIPLMRISFHPPQTRTVGRMSFHLSCQRRARKTTIKKRGRTVPILLTSKVNISINVLLETRDNVGVRTDNPYERPSEAVMS